MSRGGSLATGPVRGEANDYSQHFVDTGLRPQNNLRDVHLVRARPFGVETGSPGSMHVCFGHHACLQIACAAVQTLQLTLGVVLFPLNNMHGVH